MLLNLVTNALKYTKQGYVKIRGYIKKKLIQPKDTKENEVMTNCLVIEVQDTGSGISPEDMPKLFKPYQVLYKPSTIHSAGRAFLRCVVNIHLGTGLGLVIAKNFCRLLGGDISFESTVGTGSTFSFYMPYKDVPKESKETPPTTPSSPRKHTLEGRKVLVVDDNNSLRKILLLALKRAGCECYEAEDGQMAVNVLRKHPGIEIALIDIIMPVMDG